MKSLCMHFRAGRTGTVVGVTFLGLLTLGCAALPEQLTAGADPADAAVRAPATAYRPVLNGYLSQRPVAPARWRDQNDRAAPGRQ